MKKIIWLLICTLTFVACEQEEVWSECQTESNKNQSSLTRSAVSVPNVIDQLVGIPVNIKSVSNKTYVSAHPSGEHIYLVSSDDGSLRQRWKLEPTFMGYFINLIGGNSTYANGRFMIVNKGNYYFPQLWDSSLPSNGIGFMDSGDGITYNITFLKSFSFPTNIWSLQPENTNSEKITAGDPYNKGDLIKWEIIPVDDFRVEEITYDLTTDDNLSVIPTQVAIKTLVNDTDIPATRTLSFQEVVTNESSYSELVGLKINDKISATFKVGIPKFLDAGFTGETSSERTWNYTVGQKETQSYTISETITQEVPARTTIEAKLIATKYDATMTYIAKLYGINCGKTIFLKGKWNGVVVQESRIVLTQKGKVLRTIKLDK